VQTLYLDAYERVHIESAVSGLNAKHKDWPKMVASLKAKK
jgi:hypothetical protein